MEIYCFRPSRGGVEVKAASSSIAGAYASVGTVSIIVTNAIIINLNEFDTHTHAQRLHHQSTSKRQRRQSDRVVYARARRQFFSYIACACAKKHRLIYRFRGPSSVFRRTNWPTCCGHTNIAINALFLIDADAALYRDMVFDAQGCTFSCLSLLVSCAQSI